MVLLIGDVQQAVGSESNPPRSPEGCLVATHTCEIKARFAGPYEGRHGHIRHHLEYSGGRSVPVLIDYLNGVRANCRVGIDRYRNPGSNQRPNVSVLTIDFGGNLLIEVRSYNVY